MKLTFEFEEQEAQAILDILSKEPYNNVAAIIHNIQNQARKQLDEKLKD